MTRAATRHAVTTQLNRMTAEEFAERYMDIPGVELERGEVIHVPPGGLDHSGWSEDASFLLGTWARKTKLGKVYTNEAGVITERDPDTVRGVDVLYYSYKRLPKGRRPSGFCAVPPDLVVEVYGKGGTWRKLLNKAREYLRMGVDRVWLLDPRDRSITVCRHDAEPVKLADSGEIRDRQILPGFAHEVAEFFED